MQYVSSWKTKEARIATFFTVEDSYRRAAKIGYYYWEEWFDRR